MSAAVNTMQTFYHQSVMLDEVLAFAKEINPRTIVDCTLGGAGHSKALLELFPQATLLGIDRDAEALAAAQKKLAVFGTRVKTVQARFSALKEVVAEQQLPAPDFILADFGVSSYQLDARHRGFSFRMDAPLDMRMDTQSGKSVLEMLATISEQDLARALKDLGDERYAKKIARAIVEQQPQTTGALAELVRQRVPKAKDGLHPATRTFQALRMLVNEELEEIEMWLAAASATVAVNGLVLAISFHSLEDRAVKLAFRQLCQGCVCPPQLPVCICKKTAAFALHTKKALRPTEYECEHNPRAQSAKMRVLRRLPYNV